MQEFQQSAQLLVAKAGEIVLRAGVGERRTRLNVGLLPWSAFGAVRNFPNRSHVAAQGALNRAAAIASAIVSLPPSGELVCEASCSRRAPVIASRLGLPTGFPLWPGFRGLRFSIRVPLFLDYSFRERQSSAGRPLKVNCCQLVIATGKTFPFLA